MTRTLRSVGRDLLRALFPATPAWSRPAFGKPLILRCNRCGFEVDYRGDPNEQASRAVDHSFTMHMVTDFSDIQTKET